MTKNAPSSNDKQEVVTSPFNHMTKNAPSSNDSNKNGSFGKLQIKIKSGNLLRDTEVFGKMDPFVLIEYNG
jgi:hypothetical protein